MVTIRLARFGKRKHPTYRFIVSDKRKDTKGTYLESLGHYDPHTTPPTIEVNVERVKYWFSVGAQPSNTVHNLLVTKGVIERPKRTFVKPKKKVSEPASQQPALQQAEKQESAEQQTASQEIVKQP